jgi:hypothetical protein
MTKIKDALSYFLLLRVIFCIYDFSAESSYALELKENNHEAWFTVQVILTYLPIFILEYFIFLMIPISCCQIKKYPLQVLLFILLSPLVIFPLAPLFVIFGMHYIAEFFYEKFSGKFGED